jgi:hypothetical protein
MGPDHDNIAIGHTGLVQMPCERVGSLVDLAVGEAPLGGCGGLGLDNTGALGMRLGLGAKVLLDRADVARPVEVDGGIGDVRHGEYLGEGLCHIGRGEEEEEAMGTKRMEANPVAKAFFFFSRAASTGRVPSR